MKTIVQMPVQIVEPIEREVRMTNKEAIELAIKACEKTWNEKTCKQIRDVLEQEPKIGHWIKKDYWKPLPFDTDPLGWDNYDEKTHSEKISLWYCSECDAVKGEIQPTARFCEKCGARMESEE